MNNTNDLTEKQADNKSARIAEAIAKAKAKKKEKQSQLTDNK